MKITKILQSQWYILMLWLLCILWSIYHIAFFWLNDVMKIADSFAYLQMSYFLWQFSQEWLWNGWFGFVYSIPVAVMNMFVGNDFLAAKIINILLLNVSAILIWKIARTVLPQNYSLLVIWLFFLSPSFLHFNIHVLSENIYLPLFLWLFIMVQNFMHSPNVSRCIWIACIIWIMYLTRAEAFIYVTSIWVISLTLLTKRTLSFKSFLWYWAIFFTSFFIFIFPYLFHLHTLTWEWWLTNKGASNLRQAELRGQEKMDDAGFEKAVAELTTDKTSLISGFAWGMPYDAPSIEWNLISLITKNPSSFIKRVWTNQLKLYSKNIPEIILGKSPWLYYSDDSRFSHIFFLLYCIMPLLIWIYWLLCLYKKYSIFLWITAAFFIPASLFFTLFFTLNRYFIIFLPFFYIIIVYGIYSLWQLKYWKIISVAACFQFISILLLSTLVYYNTESPKDEYYKLKQEAWVWINKNIDQNQNLKIMERFPIVTYYAGSKIRYITPYTDNIDDIYTYGNYRDIDILVVDTMDFRTYRPWLTQYIDKTPDNFSLLSSFENSKWQKVILYELKK